MNDKEHLQILKLTSKIKVSFVLAVPEVILNCGFYKDNSFRSASMYSAYFLEQEFFRGTS